MSTLKKTSIQLEPDTLDWLRATYPHMNQSEAIRMLLRRCRKFHYSEVPRLRPLFNRYREAIVEAIKEVPALLAAAVLPELIENNVRHTVDHANEIRALSLGDRLHLIDYVRGVLP